jgi:hypothetical protein
MRVLVVSPYATDFGLSVFYHRAFAQLGLESSFEAVRNRPPWTSLSERLLIKLAQRSQPIRELINRSNVERLLQRVAQIQPDLIFIIQGDDFSPQVVHDLRTLAKGPVFLYYSDHPFVSAGPTSFFWQTLPLYDCVFTFLPFLAPYLYQRGARRVEYLPFAFDPDTHVH